MFKIVALVTFLVGGQVAEQNTLTYQMPFASAEECQAALTSQQLITAGQALEARVQELIKDGEIAAEEFKVEYGCQAAE